MTSIAIPSSVTNIGILAFHGCTNVTSITVDEGNYYYDSRGGCNAIIETTTNTLIQGCNSSFIPYSVTSIDDYAFDRCSSMNSIFIPSSVTSLGGWAFCDCSSLTSINIPKSVTKIKYYAFSSCKNMDHVYCYADPQKLDWGNYDNQYYFKPNKATLFHVYNKSEWEEAFPNANVTYVEDLPMEGDANSDNRVDADDIDEIANAIVGKPSSKFNKVAADLYGDGKVDITDITRLIDLLKK